VRYEELYGQSIEDPQAFWQEQAKAIHWRKPRRRFSTIRIRRSDAGSSAARPIFATTRSTGMPNRGRIKRRWW